MFMDIKFNLHKTKQQQFLGSAKIKAWNNTNEIGPQKKPKSKIIKKVRGSSEKPQSHSSVLSFPKPYLLCLAPSQTSLSPLWFEAMVEWKRRGTLSLNPFSLRHSDLLPSSGSHCWQEDRLKLAITETQGMRPPFLHCHWDLSHASSAEKNTANSWISRGRIQTCNQRHRCAT